MSVRQNAPQAVKTAGRRLSRTVGRLTAEARMLPSFVMVGAQRSGTTSLYRALMAHPLVLPAVHHKQVNYFDLNYACGPEWYRAHFPLRSVARLRTRGYGREPVTFEASGYYMFHPLAARRLVRDLPDVKVLMMLRDPVERAYSAYQHEFARGFETEPFARALELEDERVEPESRRMTIDPAFAGFSHRHHAYRRRGQYAQQLRPFLEGLGESQVLVVESADFFSEPEREYRRVTDFLGLPPFAPRRFDTYNSRPRSPMSDATRLELRQHFEPHDEDLVQLLGRPVSWRP
jgi:Sulfotransferase domain